MLEEQCGGVPPPMRQPESLTLHRTVSSSEIFSPYDDLPVPDYLDAECLKEFESRWSITKCFVSQATLSTLNKHEILFGFTKGSRYWHASVLQIVQLTLGISVAWTVMALCTEISNILSMIGDTSASTQIPL